MCLFLTHNQPNLTVNLVVLVVPDLFQGREEPVEIPQLGTLQNLDQRSKMSEVVAEARSQTIL